MLLTKAAIFCAQKGIGRIALGPLAGNPFPDATPEFFAAMSTALSLGLAHTVVVDTPFVQMKKADVIRTGMALERAVRADALVHGATSRTALRPVQQVPRAARCVSRGRRRRPYALRGHAVALTATPTGMA